MANHYDIPKWAGKPPVGTHLDVMKEDKLVQKLMLDEKKCYLFGRNPQMNDFCTDHQSCSRVHAAFVYHKHLQRAFLVDLGSTHGTFIGSLRLESNKPTQLPPNSSFHFGASTRHYIMRERPQGNTRSVIEQLEQGDNPTNAGAAMLGLTEANADLDNLTEFNTAHNRRISMLGIGDDTENAGSRSKKKKMSITFSEELELINPEDVDPTVGRFRNMIHSTVIPGKRQRYDPGLAPSVLSHHKDMNQRPLTSSTHNLYSDLPQPHGDPDRGSNPILSSVLASRLGIALPDPAPEVDMTDPAAIDENKAKQELGVTEISQHPQQGRLNEEQPSKKKIYAKEAWPGKKPLAPPLLISSAPPTNFL